MLSTQRTSTSTTSTICLLIKIACYNEIITKSKMSKGESYHDMRNERSSGCSKEDERAMALETHEEELK